MLKQDPRQLTEYEKSHNVPFIIQPAAVAAEPPVSIVEIRAT